MKKLLLTSLVAGTLLFTGCASSQAPENSASKLIENPKKLTKSVFDESVYYYIKDNHDFAQYNKVVVPSIPVEDSKDAVIDEKIKKEISEYFTKGISVAVNEVVKTNSGNKTLKLEIAVEKVDVVYEDLKFYNFIPVSLAVKAISRGTGIEDKDLMVAIAMRLTDVDNQEIIALAVDSKKVENVNEIKDVTLEKVKPILDEWITRFKLRIDDFSKGIYKDLKKD